jgi:serine/threonine protein kinase
MYLQRGRWRAIRPVHHGGQGSVFLAFDTHRRRKMYGHTGICDQIGTDAEGEDNIGALKVLHQPLGSVQKRHTRDRIQTEVAAYIATSGDDNIARILDHDVYDGWLVTEYFPKGTLRDSLCLYQGDLTKALTALRSLVSATNTLHRKGFVHCDITPENVYISAEKGLILGDMGFACPISHSAVDGASIEFTVTRTDHAGSEERIFNPRPRLDVYGLGLLLWSMLSGGASGRTTAAEIRHVLKGKCFSLTRVEELLGQCIVQSECQALESASALCDVISETIELLRAKHKYALRVE